MAALIIALRIIVPLVILRFPLTGVGLATVLDWYDFRIIGHWESYQVIDKWLDFYYLAICMWVARSWVDPIARRLAYWLFGYRALGVILMGFVHAEWLLFIFPDVFGWYFIFYHVFMRFSRSSRLFTSWRDIWPVLVALLIPKLFQEYVLHIYLPNPASAPSWVVEIAAIPYVILALPFCIPPLLILWLCVKRVHQKNK